MKRREFVEIGLGIAAGPALVACGDATGVPGHYRLAARPGVPTLTAEPGVITDLALGGARDGLFYLPAGYDGSTPIPLVVTLHGAGGEGTNFQSYVARGEERGFALLSPDSRDRTWDLVLGNYGPDVTFLDGALAHVFARCRIDPARVALAGFSDGASYALSLGRANGDLFTHLVGYSPGFVDDVADRTGRPGVFVSHGTNDQILSFAITRDEIVPQLESDDLTVTFRQFVGGHTVPAEVSEDALDWFLS